MTKLFLRNKEFANDALRRQAYGEMTALVGILCNIILFLSKLIAGLLTGSVSIMADAFNNLSDTGSSVVTLLGFRMAGLPADKEHPFGHGRMEYISGFVVSIVIIVIGFELFKSSFYKIIMPQDMKFNFLSLGIMIASIALKLWMFFFQRRIAKKIDSPTLRATSGDSISDVAATTAVVISLLINKIFGLNLDGYMGCVVALFIFYTGVTTAKDTLNPLLGQAPELDFVENIKKEVLSFSGISGVHDIIIHSYGASKKLISLHAEVPYNADILKIHNIVDNIERKLNEIFECEAVIHVDPIITDDKTTNSLHLKLNDIVKAVDNSLSIHDFRVIVNDNETKVLFDVCIPFRFDKSESQIEENIKNELKNYKEDCTAIITMDRFIG